MPDDRPHSQQPRPRDRPALLCISQSFSPDTSPTAIRAGKLLQRLSADWDITVLTEAPGPHASGQVQVQSVRAWRPARLLAALRRMRLSKLVEMIVWPDESIFWVPAAILAGRRLIREREPSAIVVFMMPYSPGLAGIVLSRLTGLALVLNLDDSLTCTDMHPFFPTRLHHRLARALEDLYARRADAVVYVSETNLQAVASRLPQATRRKLHLVRYGADPALQRPPSPVVEAPLQERAGGRFEIAYVGAMSGWWSLIGQDSRAGLRQRLYGAWTRLGRYELTVLDQRTSSPEVIGRAIIEAVSEHPGWGERVGLTLHGDPYPADVVARALASAGVQSVVSVRDPVAHERVAGIIAAADLLFLTLPRRVDGSRGGRISAKTYEYLMTDRPILAAVPRGENWDYLEGKPGVWLVDPDDQRRMKEVIVELAEAKFAGGALTFDRAQLREQLSYDARAAEFGAVIEAAIEGRGGASQPARISPR